MRSLRAFVVVFLLVFVVGIGAAAAAPVTATPALPFIWVRAAPSSYAPAIYTVYPTFYATLETTGNTQWDGYQTWAEVFVIANGSIRGWVEQGSLVGASQAAPYQNFTPYVQAQPQYQMPYQPQYPMPFYGRQGQTMPFWNQNGQMYQNQGVPRFYANRGWNNTSRHHP